MCRILLAALATLSVVSAQQAGTVNAENHPPLTVSTCTKSGGCSSISQSIVLDANWRWVHTTSGYTNCYTGQSWDSSLCPDSSTCVQNCALDGASYSSTYGITTSGNTVNLELVTGSNVGSRVYLMQDRSNYQTFNLLNGEFAFDVDVSQLACGLNGALYFTQMDQDGGMKRFPSNKAGAAFGTGYCDAQCPQDIKFINGQANVAGWNAGRGNLGSCCSEMDIWEANSFANAYTAHPCNVNSATACTGGGCTSTCDAAGCDFNPWRLGNNTFYGPGLTINTQSKVTVVTQFITDDNTNQGNLIQINRFYVQNGQVIPNSYTSISGVNSVNSISDNFCSQKKVAFSENNVFASMGGLRQMGAAFKAGMVLVMSIWDDHSANMLWLDSNFPTSANPSSPGVNRGPCSTSSGNPSDVEKNSASATVSFSNIKWGELGSTFSGSSSTGGGGGSTGGGGSGGSGSGGGGNGGGSSSCAAQYAQCGGQNWSGLTCCQAPYTCQVGNPYYSQCL